MKLLHFLILCFVFPCCGPLLVLMSLPAILYLQLQANRLAIWYLHLWGPLLILHLWGPLLVETATMAHEDQGKDKSEDDADDDADDDPD